MIDFIINTSYKCMYFKKDWECGSSDNRLASKHKALRTIPVLPKTKTKSNRSGKVVHIYNPT
jgi:hypothetical protein